MKDAYFLSQQLLKKKELEKDGIKVSQKRVARRMKILGIKSVIIKKYNPGPAKSKVDDTNKPNLLKQEFFINLELILDYYKYY